MERILTAEQMRSADKYTIEKLGVSEQTLIERAGEVVVEEIKKRFFGGRVLVCIGKGNNGKDGVVIAEKLSCSHGFTVSVLNVYNGIFKMFEQKFDIIVDCIFGIGLNREVLGIYKTAIEKINDSGAFVISCDIPSGLNADTGYPMGIAVKADLTVAIQEYKLGHFLNDGIDYSGEVVSRDIGISVWEQNIIERFNSIDVAPFFLPRKRNVNKGNFKKVAVMGGSKNYPGSVILSLNAISAYKSGVGYCNMAIPESLISVYAPINPECTVTCIKDENGNMIFDSNALDIVMKNDAIAFGMGMGVNEDTYKSLKYLLDNYSGRLLIDADGINTIAEYGVSILKNKRCEVVLTPHIGEFARLIKENKNTIMSGIIEKAKRFANEYKVVLAVKSAITVITDGDRVILNTTGSQGMAKAGSGDALSGFITGIISRREDFLDSVAVGCYVYGKAGEIATKSQNEYTVTPSDTIKAISEAINII